MQLLRNLEEETTPFNEVNVLLNESWHICKYIVLQAELKLTSIRPHQNGSLTHAEVRMTLERSNYQCLKNVFYYWDACVDETQLIFLFLTLPEYWFGAEKYFLSSSIFERTSSANHILWESFQKKTVRCSKVV